MNPHPFDSGGRTGMALVFPCQHGENGKFCGRPDSHPIHKDAAGQPLQFVTSSTEQCPLHPNCYKPAGHAPPCERWGGLGIDDATAPFDHGTMRTTWVRCGNCKKQYEVPVEQPHRYAAVMAHKYACPAGSKEAVEAQHAQLVRDFARQHERRPVTKRPWWKFWRRGQ